MARVIFENLTDDQAKELAAWYDGQGEQDADLWFECNDLKAPFVDNKKGIEFLANGDVIVPCK